jgi:hypothetical protein
MATAAVTADVGSHLRVKYVGASVQHAAPDDRSMVCSL